MSTYIFIGISHSLTIMKLMMDIWYVLRVLNLQRPFFGFLQSLIVLKLRVNRWCILVFLSCIYVLSFRSYLILIAPPLSLSFLVFTKGTQEQPKPYSALAKPQGLSFIVLFSYSIKVSSLIKVWKTRMRRCRIINGFLHKQALSCFVLSSNKLQINSSYFQIFWLNTNSKQI